MQSWLPTREAALARLAAFLPEAGRDYARRRNYDLGTERHGNVSMLSPWVRHRLILERHSLSAAEKFVQETCWRTYWKGWLEHRPSVWRDYQASVRCALDSLETDGELRSRWEAATSARTGIDCFDHWARELIETGYLHNHARMWFASIWIFTLELPWALGADFFLRHFLDGDPASNTLSWRWVAGLQTRGMTYLARPSNIARYTESRFRPGGQLAAKAPPPEGFAHPALGPVPVGDGAWDRRLSTGILLTEEDLHPESLFEDTSQCRTVIALQATAQRSPLPVPANVQQFASGALADAIQRMRTEPSPSATAISGPNAAEVVAEQARAAAIEQLVTAYAPTGPTADALQPVAQQLESAGITLVPALRNWNRLAWPHATKGFLRSGSASARHCRRWALSPPHRLNANNPISDTWLFRAERQRNAPPPHRAGVVDR